MNGQDKTVHQEYTQEMVAHLQQEAFMEGYMHAIEILKEHLVKKTK